MVIKGENVSLGYANSLIDLNKGDANKKILFTGDLGFKDNENFYYRYNIHYYNECDNDYYD